MENRINVAELLKNCPKGMELDCSMYENLYFDRVVENYRYPISCYTICDDCKTIIHFTEFGRFNEHETAKCVIYPKGKTTWEGFVSPCKFKVGDIIKKKGLADIYAIKIVAVKPPIYTFQNKGFQYIEFIDKNYELVPNKFDIKTLVPFVSRVLVRDSEAEEWRPAVWGFCNGRTGGYPFEVVCGQGYTFCIPYEGNEHLLGTTEDCEDRYKLWLS